MGENYGVVTVNLERSAEANSARWDAMGSWYTPKREEDKLPG